MRALAAAAAVVAVVAELAAILAGGLRRCDDDYSPATQSRRFVLVVRVDQILP